MVAGLHRCPGNTVRVRKGQGRGRQRPPQMTQLTVLLSHAVLQLLAFATGLETQEAVLITVRFRMLCKGSTPPQCLLYESIQWSWLHSQLVQQSKLVKRRTWRVSVSWTRGLNVVLEDSAASKSFVLYLAGRRQCTRW